MNSKHSHYHCWDNENRPCNIPLEKHTQCCLCDTPYPLTTKHQESWEERFDDFWTDMYFRLETYEPNLPMLPPGESADEVRAFISETLEAERLKAHAEGYVKGIETAEEAIRLSLINPLDK